MSGKLSLVATPIGNLSDFSERAKRTLEEADIIAAEDTRNSIKLLNHFNIKTALTSYHEHNKKEKGEELITLLEQGKNIALVTDAGMPAISDPGEDLVKLCRDRDIDVTVVPGPCAAVSALSISGIETGRFVFEGFLPTDKKERDYILEELKGEERTIIIYEAPHRLSKTLEVLRKTFGDERELSIVRELTKIHEETEILDFAAACALYSEGGKEAKGEYVLVIRGKKREEKKKEAAEKWNEMGIEQHVEFYESRGFERKEAMKLAAKDRNLTKREVYQACIELEKER